VRVSVWAPSHTHTDTHTLTYRRVRVYIFLYVFLSYALVAIASVCECMCVCECECECGHTKIYTHLCHNKKQNRIEYRRKHDMLYLNFLRRLKLDFKQWHEILEYSVAIRTNRHIYKVK
jgi:hypothetical protein